MRKRAITILHLTPALGRMLETAKGKSLPSVRRIFFGGDLLSRQDIRSMRELAPNAEIVSFYGATETQRAVGYFAVSDDRYGTKFAPSRQCRRGGVHRTCNCCCSRRAAN